MLTDAKARAAKPRAKSYKLTDSNRLYLLVTPSGGKHWRWSYRYDGREKAMAFGSYPMVTLSDARSKRYEAHAVLVEGRDPAIVKKLKIGAQIEAARQTFERTARAWHENAKGNGRSGTRTTCCAASSAMRSRRWEISQSPISRRRSCSPPCAR